MSATEERTAYVGSPVKRREDEALLTGRGTYVDNMAPAGTVSMVVVRSPYAHARVTSVDLDAARQADGVVAAFSAADLRDDWKAPMPCAWPVTEDMKSPDHYPLTDVPCYQGDGVAVVLAETRSQAKDAAELVEVDYEPLEAVADVAKALDDGAPLVHPDLGTNECYVWRLDTDATGEAIEDADVAVTRTYYQPRLIPNAMEPRAVLAVPGTTADVTLYSATQIPHILRLLAAASLGMPETKVRVVAPDVGGAFGSKLDVYAEELLAIALARRLERPVKWTEERSENYVAVATSSPSTRWARRRTGRSRTAARGSRPRWAHTFSSSRRASRCSARGSTRGRTRSPTTASSSRACSRTRHRPTHTAAPDGRRRRT
jgi:carbon-monoxide dehydrogenase large subunit